MKETYKLNDGNAIIRHTGGHSGGLTDMGRLSVDGSRSIAPPFGTADT
jgi:hypothetical protein